MKKPREIKDADEMFAICQDILTDFVDSFTFKSGLKRKPYKDELEQLDIDKNVWFLTNKGNELYERQLNRLNKLILLKFDEEMDVDILTYY